MSLSEKVVRKTLIDQALAASGWRVVSNERWQAADRIVADAVEEFPTDSGASDRRMGRKTGSRSALTQKAIGMG